MKRLRGKERDRRMNGIFISANIRSRTTNTVWKTSRSGKKIAWHIKSKLRKNGEGRTGRGRCGERDILTIDILCNVSVSNRWSEIHI